MLGTSTLTSSGTGVTLGHAVGVAGVGPGGDRREEEEEGHGGHGGDEQD